MPTITRVAATQKQNPATPSHVRLPDGSVRKVSKLPKHIQAQIQDYYLKLTEVK